MLNLGGTNNLRNLVFWSVMGEIWLSQLSWRWQLCFWDKLPFFHFERWCANVAIAARSKFAVAQERAGVFRTNYLPRDLSHKFTGGPLPLVAVWFNPTNKYKIHLHRKYQYQQDSRVTSYTGPVALSQSVLFDCLCLKPIGNYIALVWQSAFYNEL